MANSDKSNRRDLMAYTYKGSALSRARKENEKRPEGADYTWVIYNIEIFPLPTAVVEAYNQSPNYTKKKQYKLWKKWTRKVRLQEQQAKNVNAIETITDSKIRRKPLINKPKEDGKYN